MPELTSGAVGKVRVFSLLVAFICTTSCDNFRVGPSTCKKDCEEAYNQCVKDTPSGLPSSHCATDRKRCEDNCGDGGIGFSCGGEKKESSALWENRGFRRQA